MRLITLGSASVGYGKSFVAVALGASQARRGVTTCLVDLDLGTADLHLMTGRLDARRSVHDLLRGQASSLEEVMAPIPGIDGLHLVAGPRETVAVGGLSTDEIARLGSEMRRLPVDVVIADLQAGVGQQVLDLFLLGDHHWVVATNEEQALADAERFLRLARLRRTARGTASRPSRRPRVYTSLDDLVRDMNSLRQEISPARDTGFAPGLVINRCRPDQPSAESRLLDGLFEGKDPIDEPPLIGMIPDDPAAAGPGPRQLSNLPLHSPAMRAATEIARALAEDLAGDLPGAEDLLAECRESLPV